MSVTRLSPVLTDMVLSAGLERLNRVAACRQVCPRDGRGQRPSHAKRFTYYRPGIHLLLAVLPVMAPPARRDRYRDIPGGDTRRPGFRLPRRSLPVLALMR